MDSIELIRETLARSTDITLSKVEQMADHGLVPPTPHGGAHTLWLLGHLATIEGQVVQGFGLGRDNPLAHWEPLFDGEEVSTEASDYPPFDEVLARCREARAATRALIDQLTEDDLDRVAPGCPAGHEATFGTLRRCLQFVADHWLMHRGQLADCRRAAGLQRMWF